MSCLLPNNVPLIMTSLSAKPYLLALMNLMDKTTDRDRISEGVG
jgi:hypothetical protein